jgi:hypothetical protein
MTDIIKSLLQLNNELLSLAETKFRFKSITRESRIKDVCIFILAKSTKTFRASIILCNQGYGEDSAVLIRSLLENLINLAYIKKEGEETAKLFILYPLLDNKKKLEAMKNDNLLNKHNKLYREEIETAVDMHKKQCEKIKNACKRDDNHRWACISLKEMAIETGLEIPYYDKVYWLISQIAHTNASNSDSFINVTEDTLIVDDLPSEKWVDESLIVAFDCYAKILHLFNEIFQLNLGDQIKILEKRYAEIMLQQILSK